MDIEAIWRELEASPAAGEGATIRRLRPETPLELFAAVEWPDGTPALHLEVPTHDLPHLIEVPESRGFELKLRPTVPGPGGRVRLSLRLREVEWREVFAVLVRDIALGLPAGGPGDGVVRAFLARLATWQRFMQRHGPGGLGYQEQLGLRGELEILSLLLDHLPPQRALSCWRGPLSGIHDFDAPGAALEVKATTWSPATTFRVDNLAQLDETRVGRLLLCHVALDVGVAVDGSTLPDYIDHMLGRLAAEPSAVSHLKDLLQAAGYLAAQRTRYLARKFRVRKRRFYRVEEGFPRLRASDVPPGVSACEYEVELVACASFKLEDDRAMALLLGERDE